MAEFVMLPIYDENDGLTSRSLRVDTRHFLGTAGSEIAHRFITVVDESPAEIDALDRIVSGLAPRRVQKLTDDIIPDPVDESRKRLQEWQDEVVKNVRLHNVAVVKADVGMGSITFEEAGHYDIGESLKQGKPIKPDWWRTIPGFSKYELSSYRAVATKADHKSVSIMKGRTDNVLLTNDEGEHKRMSIDFLMQKTFPELQK